MTNIKIRFIGEVQIELDGEMQGVTHNKYEALFLYLIVHKKCTRNELINLFWDEVPEDKARKNLRNAIYNIKKVYGSHLITNTGYTLISICEDVKIELDLYEIAKNNDVFMDINKYTTFTFLKNYNTNCSGFEHWLSIQRRLYNDIFYNQYIKAKERAKISNKNNALISICLKLIEINNLDDQNYIDLMVCYDRIGKYSKSIQVYKNLKQILKAELDIEPSNEATNLYHQIIKSKNFAKAEYNANKSSEIYGRIKEKVFVVNNIDGFCKNIEFRNIMIYGEKGIGKTAFAKHVASIGSNGTRYIYYDPQRIDLLAKDDGIIHLLEYLSSMQSAQLNPMSNSQIRMILNQFMRAVENKKVCIIIDGLERFTSAGIKALYNCLDGLCSSNVLFIMIYTKGYHENDRFVHNYFLDNSIFKTLEFKRFEKEETEVMLDIRLSTHLQSNNIYQQVYSNSKGIPYFIKMIVNNLKKGLVYNDVSDGYIDNYLMDLKEAEREICEFLCVFDQPVNLIEFMDIYNHSNMDITMIESLSRKSILTEVILKSETYLIFSVPMVKQHLYNSLYLGKKIAFHNKVGDYYRVIYEENNNRKELLQDILHNYSNTGVNYKHVYYKLKYLEHRLNYSDEFFPVWHTYQNHYETLFLKRDETYEILDEIESKLAVIESSITKEEIRECLLIFYYLKGRTYIRDNNFEIGIQYINKLLEMIETETDDEYLFRAYYEFIIRGLKSNDLDLYKEYLVKLSEIGIIHKMDIYLSIYYRMVGLYNVLTHNYEESHQYYDQSIETIKKAKGFFNYNFLNMVASINYKGDVYKYQKDYINAELCYKKAIEICENKKVSKSMNLLYKNYGEILYMIGDPQLAKTYLDKSIQYSNRLSSYWERSIAECYLAVIYFDEGDADKAKEHLAKGEIYISEYSGEYELEIYSWAKYHIGN